MRGRGIGQHTPKVRSQNVRLLIPEPDSEDFLVQDRNGKILVIPSRFKHKWQTPELWYRSLILDSRGNVLSAGLPKFRNYGEDEQETKEFEAYLAQGKPVLFTEKMDGSLAIRSVIDGEVIWRTRGTFDGGDQHGPAIRQTAELYPILADPNFMAGSSMHFEFVHPDPQFQIIIKYDQPDLVFLSAVRHHDLRLYNRNELEMIAKDNQLNLVKMHDLPTDVENLTSQIHSWEDSEGVVARYNNEQNYVKFKAAKYLTQHRLRYQFSARVAMELCKEEDFETEQDYIDHLYKKGMDWEVVQSKLVYFHVYDKVRRDIQKYTQEAQAFVDQNQDVVKANNKAYAELVHDHFTASDPRRSLAFALSKGKAEKLLYRMRERMIPIKMREYNLDLEEQ